MSIYTQQQHRWPVSRPTAAEQEATQRRGLYLRAENERAIWQLRKLLPFRWQVAIKKPAPITTGMLYPLGIPAIHILLLEPSTSPVARAAGDMLCSVAVDTGTGEVRFEAEAAPRLNDGNGGEYEPAPTCKNCLKAAQKLK